MRSSYSNQYAYHSSIPHSKSLEHYNEPPEFMEHHNASRHSFDRPCSSNYKNYDCTDGIHSEDRSNGYHVGSYQPNLAITTLGDRYPLSATIPHPDQHYSEIGGFERGEISVGTSMDKLPLGPCSCCLQNSFNNCSSMQKSKNSADYSNCRFAK